ncbi:unnamed protein product [Rangifer tarandus platyrhynchus]|uniref:Uncharacterized protein n=2 Tax=Rangifer tarandus platyrhynchus TaxID=3082113 RepID=A0AC60A7W8_RANTA|nr:unnamed protein product [Rangifer tarandus platyrhynchus]
MGKTPGALSRAVSVEGLGSPRRQDGVGEQPCAMVTGTPPTSPQAGRAVLCQGHKSPQAVAYGETFCWGCRLTISSSVFVTRHGVLVSSEGQSLGLCLVFARFLVLHHVTSHPTRQW